MSKRPNFISLFLPTELYLAIIDVQSKKQIGKAAAILYMINEGLRKRGFIDEETYELYEQKYGTPLLVKVRRNRQQRHARLEVRCGWVGCRRVAVAMVRYKDEEVLPACPDHLKEAKHNPNFVVLADGVEARETHED